MDNEQKNEAMERDHNEIKKLLKDAENSIYLHREKHDQEIKELIKELKENSKESLEQSKKSMEETRKIIMTGSVGFLAMILSGFIIFLYQESKHVTSSMLELHNNISSARDNISSAREILNDEVADFQQKASEFSQQLDVAIERNEDAISNLSLTQQDLDQQIAEASEVRERYSAISENLSSAQAQLDQQLVAVGDAREQYQFLAADLSSKQNELERQLINVAQVQDEVAQAQEQYQTITSEIINVRDSFTPPYDLLKGGRIVRGNIGLEILEESQVADFLRGEQELQIDDLLEDEQEFQPNDLLEGDQEFSVDDHWESVQEFQAE